MICIRSLFLAVIFGVLSLDVSLAGDKSSPAEFSFSDSPNSVVSRHRFSLGMSVLAGTEVRFDGLGGFTNLRNPALGVTDGERVYDNGFVRPDSAGDADGLTWNWGYTDAAQWDPVDDVLRMKIDNSTPSLGATQEDIAPGAEIGYGLVLGNLGGDRSWHWGVKTHLGYHRLATSGRLRARHDVERTTDAFGLGGVVPPQAPYSGSFSGPGPLLDSQAGRSFSTVSELALVDARLETDADLFTLGLGTFVEIPLGRWQAEVSAGATVTWIDSRMQVDQTVAIPGIEAQRRRTSDSDSAWLPGVYVGLGLSFALTDALSLSATGRWQTMESFQHGTDGFGADYDFDHLFAGGLGLVWRW